MRAHSSQPSPVHDHRFLFHRHLRVAPRPGSVSRQDSNTPDHEFRVIDRLHDEWENGKEYYGLAGQRIRVPKAAGMAPSREALAWHAEVRFK